MSGSTAPIVISHASRDRRIAETTSLAQVSVAVLYKNGWGVRQDYAAATQWYLKAANQGNAVAQRHVGLSYDDGVVGPKDPAQARTWMQKAAANGDDQAKQWLAKH
jgi:TPR repeat protein